MTFRGLGKQKSCGNYKKQLFLNKILMEMTKTIVSKQNPLGNDKKQLFFNKTFCDSISEVSFLKKHFATAFPRSRFLKNILRQRFRGLVS